MEQAKKMTAQEALDALEYAESIINTVHEPLVILNGDLMVVSANRSFYEVFKVKPEETEKQLIYDLGNHQWNIPKLRELLEGILPKSTSFDNFEIEHDFPGIGKRTMLLNARGVLGPAKKPPIILLAIEDITEPKKILDQLHENIRRLEALRAVTEGNEHRMAEMKVLIEELNRRLLRKHI